MIFLAMAVLFGSPDPMDIHAGDFLDRNPSEFLKAANEAYQMEDWQTAAEQYLSSLEIDPGNSTAIYNLACCYGLMGEEELASLYLKRSFVSGFDNIGLANADTDFDQVRESQGFTSLLDSLNTAVAEKNEKLGEIHWLDTVESFYYRVNFPDGFNPPNEVPLVVGLHGLGSSPDSFMRIWELIDEPNFIFVVPQAPYSIGDDSYSWYHGEYGTEKWGHSLLLAGNYVCDLIEQIKLEYPVSDVYLFGFSQGGCLTLYTGLSHPELFTAIIPASGWLEEELIAPDLISVATSMEIDLMHSPDDTGVPFEASEETLALLTYNGWNVQLHQTSDGHRVDMVGLNAILTQLGLTGN